VKDELEIEAKVSGNGLIEGTCGQENWKNFHENRSSYRDLKAGPQDTKQVGFNATATLGSNCSHLMNSNGVRGCTAMESWFDSMQEPETLPFTCTDAFMVCTGRLGCALSKECTKPVPLSVNISRFEYFTTGLQACYKTATQYSIKFPPAYLIDAFA
jgi:hypothetical protein